MSDRANAALLGLHLVEPLLKELWLGQPVEFGKPRILLGRRGLAGTSRPLPSSAADVRVGDAPPLTLPAPLPDDSGPARFYLHAGRTLVMPTVRLLVRSAQEGPEKAKVEYVEVAQWLADALKTWRFRLLVKRAESNRPAAITLFDYLRASPCYKESGVAGGLILVGKLLRYALFGASRGFRVGQLWVPRKPIWLRPVKTDTAFAERCARVLVVSACRIEPASNEEPSVPVSGLRAEAYRAQPAGRDQGLDPVHTPEGYDIRLTGRLGAGVALGERRTLVVPDGMPPLSPSTSRIPFAGYNDPRRLLLATNMQVQAVPVSGQELPRVRQGGAPDSDPPGTNLRIGYLAWQGLNHEDAWVVSRRAAERLTMKEVTDHYLTVRSLECRSKLWIKEGDRLIYGKPLIDRFAPAILLTNDPKLLGRIFRRGEFDEVVRIRPEQEDWPPHEGVVREIEEWDLLAGTGLPKGWELPPEVRAAYRTVYRIRIERELPLRVGDKLANRHGHKGIVGAILDDDRMPRWQGEALDALIDPTSILNRSNWGQVYETLAGAVMALDPTAAPPAWEGPEVLRRASALGADGNGRWAVEPPATAADPDWGRNTVSAVAGVQFVMRMPHHACDKLSGSSGPRRGRRRAQRFGEMDYWALWAHDLAAPPDKELLLSEPAKRLARVLETAGFHLSCRQGALLIGRLPLEGAPPQPSAGVRHVMLSKPSEQDRRRDAPTQLAEGDRGSSAKRAPSLKSVRDLYDELDTTEANEPGEEERPEPLLQEASGRIPAHSTLTKGQKVQGPVRRTVFVFDPPVEGVELPRHRAEAQKCKDRAGSPQSSPAKKPRGRRKEAKEATEAGPERITLRWLPIPPPDDRPARTRLDGSMEPHPLTAALRRVARALRARMQPEGTEPDAETGDQEAEEPEQGDFTEQELRRAVQDLMKEAYSVAVGLQATGLESSKQALMRREVLGRRLEPSARATAAPGGPLGLALDEVGVPPTLARVLFGPGLPADDEELAGKLNGLTVWLKRDPVLHRWGLLPVRLRVIPNDPKNSLAPGDTARLPASLLGPMGADFDGDTVAFFRCPPGVRPDLADKALAPCRPPALCYDTVSGKAMFKPGKQYLYGLFLLARDASRLSYLQSDLAQAGAPAWPEGEAALALERWVKEASQRQPRGEWWSLLEQHALRAVATSPGMGLGVLTAAELASLEVVACGAAKNLYKDTKDRQAVERILGGRSLDIYQAGSTKPDPVKDVMVLAKVSVGLFGGALRRLLYALRDLTSALVRDAQALTEQATQKALSVKGGRPPIIYAQYARLLTILLDGKRDGLDALSAAEVSADLMEIVNTLRDALERLCRGTGAPAWADWLRRPYQLQSLVPKDSPLRVPLSDPRLWCWLAEFPDNSVISAQPAARAGQRA